MIIKSLSRKGKTGHFRQLYDYIAREAHGDALWHNFLYSEPDRERTVRTFEDNAKHIQKSPRHNILYHEVISLKRLSKDLEELQIEALRDIGRKYLNARAGTQLGYGAIHTNQKDSIHLHLMISSNGVESNRRVRIPKFEFTQIQKNIETTLQQEYPALSEKTIYNKPWDKNKKETHKEQQLKRRTGKPTKKELLKAELLQAFYQANTQNEAISFLNTQGITLENRGKNLVAIKDKLRCRLSTLGVDSHFERIELPTEEREKLNQIDSLKHLFQKKSDAKKLKKKRR